MKILAADLWPAGYPERTYEQATRHELTAGQARLKQLIENVLLYDQVVVPTDNFLSLHFMTRAFGAEGIASLMDEDILKFQRLSGTLVYAGAGRGITVVKVDVAKSLEAKAPVGPAWYPTGVAATAILSQLNNVELRRAKQIAAKVVHSTKELDLDVIRSELKNRVYASAASSTMDSGLRIASPDLNDLGIRPDQLRIAGSFEDYAPSDDIDKLMLIARTQLELFAKEDSGSDDISTLSPVGKVLAASWESTTALDSLYEITDVPDLGAAVMRGAISMNDIIALRNSRHWQEFTTWFHETCAKEPERVAREYVKLLKLPSLMDTPFLRTVRLFVTTVAGFINPIAGIVAGAADTYLLPKLREPSAKFFVESLEQLTKRQVHK